MKNIRWKEIVSTDDDLVSRELLAWSGLGDRWERYELNEYFDFTRDVAEHCQHIDIELSQWDGGAPGRSGTWHIVRCSNVKSLRLEMKARLRYLIESTAEKRAKKEQSKRSVDRKLRQGPVNEIEVFSYSVWDDISPSNYTCFIDQQQDSKGRYQLWVRCGRDWECTSHTAPFSQNATHAAQNLARAYFGNRYDSDVLDFVPAPILGVKDFTELFKPVS